MWRALEEDPQTWHLHKVTFPIEVLQDKNGEWFPDRDVNGDWRKLVHQRVYPSFYQACLACLQDIHSGVLEIKLTITSTALPSTGEVSDVVARALKAFAGRVGTNQSLPQDSDRPLMGLSRIHPCC